MAWKSRADTRWHKGAWWERVAAVRSGEPVWVLGEFAYKFFNTLCRPNRLHVQQRADLSCSGARSGLCAAWEKVSPMPVCSRGWLSLPAHRHHSFSAGSDDHSGWELLGQLEGKWYFLLPFLITWKKQWASTAAKSSSESNFIIPVSWGTLAPWCPWKTLQNVTPSYPAGPFSQGTAPPPPPPHTCPKHTQSCQAFLLCPCSSVSRSPPLWSRSHGCPLHPFTLPTSTFSSTEIHFTSLPL